MKIRTAKKEDAEAIANIHLLAWRSAYKDIMPDEYLRSLSITERTKYWLEALSERGPGINVVVEQRSSVAGFCVYGPARDKNLSNVNAGELVALNILPNAWGKGLGTELVKYVIESAINDDWSSLYLWVIKENLRARSLYELMGFENDGNEKIDSSLAGCELHELRYIHKLS